MEDSGPHERLAGDLKDDESRRRREYPIDQHGSMLSSITGDSNSTNL